MTAPGVKHGGCRDCGSKDEPVLTSVMDDAANWRAGSVAVCSACLSRRLEGSN